VRASPCQRPRRGGFSHAQPDSRAPTYETVPTAPLHASQRERSRPVVLVTHLWTQPRTTTSPGLWRFATTETPWPTKANLCGIRWAPSPLRHPTWPAPPSVAAHENAGTTLATHFINAATMGRLITLRDEFYATLSRARTLPEQNQSAQRQTCRMEIVPVPSNLVLEPKKRAT